MWSHHTLSHMCHKRTFGVKPGVFCLLFACAVFVVFHVFVCKITSWWWAVRVCACIPPSVCDSLRRNFKKLASSFLCIPGIKPRFSGAIAVPLLMALCIVFIILCIWPPCRDHQSVAEEHCNSFKQTRLSIQKRNKFLYLRSGPIQGDTREPNRW